MQNILIAVPGISYEKILMSKLLVAQNLLDIGPFNPTLRTLDVFPKEMKNIFISGLWGINIPHWPLEKNCTNGVAGPGKPQKELFYPKEIEADMKELVGQYDKWRPYPAEVLTRYQKKMARKFAFKRSKFFEHIFKYTQWETIFWVEHSPVSLAHLDENEALKGAELVLAKSLRITNRRPSVTYVLFSPYGVGDRDGFVVSNRIECSLLKNWACIRRYLKGEL